MIPWSTWFVAAAAAFGAVTLRGLLVARSDPTGRRTHLLAALATAISAACYAAMALGVGVLSLDGSTAFLPRYVGWLTTVPLMVGVLCRLGNLPRRLTVGVVALSFGTTATGAVGAFVDSPVLSVGGPLLVVVFLYTLVRVLPRHASFAGRPAAALFSKLRLLLLVLWPMYVVVLLIAPTGEVRLLVTDTSVLVVAYLDVLFVAGFATIVQNERAGVSDAAAASGRPAPDPAR